MDIESRTVDDITVIELKGTYSCDNRPRQSLSEVVKALLESGRRKFIVNLDEAEIASDTGVGDIIASFASVINQNGIIKFVTGSNKSVRLFAETCVETILELYPTLEAALESFADTGSG